MAFFVGTGKSRSKADRIKGRVFVEIHLKAK